MSHRCAPCRGSEGGPRLDWCVLVVHVHEGQTLISQDTKKTCMHEDETMVVENLLFFLTSKLL